MEITGLAIIAAGFMMGLGAIGAAIGVDWRALACIGVH